MDKEVIKNATPEQFYENVSGILYTLSLNETGGVDCNMYCSIKDVEQKDQTIADLEAKLAESEKKVDEFHDKLLDEIQNKVDREVELTNCLNNVVDERDQLKQQLAEKDAEVQSWKDGTMVVKLGKLEQQLAEKEKEIEELKKGVYKVTLGTTPSNQIDFTENFYVIQNQTAIEALEKVKESLEDCYGYDYPHLYHFIQSKVDEKIDQQIAELKGEK